MHFTLEHLELIADLANATATDADAVLEFEGNRIVLMDRRRRRTTRVVIELEWGASLELSRECEEEVIALFAAYPSVLGRAVAARSEPGDEVDEGDRQVLESLEALVRARGWRRQREVPLSRAVQA
jgi:hypothetical protein